MLYMMPPVTRGKGGSNDEKEEGYRRQRDKNNEAVKKSRLKSKQRTSETFSRVSTLKAENQVLEEKVRTLSKGLQVLKELIQAQASSTGNSKLQDCDLEKLLEDIPDDGEPSYK